MKKNVLWIIGIILAIALFAGAYMLYGKLSAEYASTGLAENQTVNEQNTDSGEENSEAATGEEQDYKAPDFTVINAEGAEVKLSDYFGKPIVLNFWASWCPPCKQEMPHFEEAFKKHTDVQFLMVNATTSDRESKEKASEYIKGEGYTFPVFYDTDGNAVMTYGASGLPMTIFIDENGNLVTYANGMISAELLEKGIEMIK